MWAVEGEVVIRGVRCSVLLVTPGDSGFPDGIQVASYLTMHRRWGLTNNRHYFSRIWGLEVWDQGVGGAWSPGRARSQATVRRFLVMSSVEESREK